MAKYAFVTGGVVSSLGKGIALLDPEFPPDIGVYVVGFESNGLENPEGLFEGDFSNPVSGHGDHCSAWHLRLHSGETVALVYVRCLIPRSYERGSHCPQPQPNPGERTPGGGMRKPLPDT